MAAAVSRSGLGVEGISICLKPEPRGASGRGGEGGTSASTSMGRGGGGGDLIRSERGIGLSVRKTVGLLPVPLVKLFSICGALEVSPVLASGTGVDVLDRGGGGV